MYQNQDLLHYSQMERKSNTPITHGLPRPIGLAGVIERLGLKLPPPAVRSSVVAGARKTRIDNDVVYEQYPKVYATKGLFDDLKFAVRYEPIDLGVFRAAFEKISTKDLETWIGDELTGIYARKIWFLFEFLTDQVLPLPDVPPTGYVDLLNPKIQFTGASVRIRRQRINDNLLGNRDYCPHIRLTEKLKRWMADALDAQAQRIVENSDPSVLARAVRYLYTSETKSSFAIEGERPGKSRSDRFIAALENAAEFDPMSKDGLVGLQNQIVDPRFEADGWRTIQNYVGQTMRDYSEQVHFVSPRPDDVSGLIDAWMRFVGRMQSSRVDPIAAAAAISFGFVFIHPFEDGNGRIHRFLIHHELARSGFAPKNLIFPVSVVMLRERAEYDKVLTTYSRSILPFCEFTLNNQGEMTVENDTRQLYAYWDATKFAEFLYGCVEETLRSDLLEELRFLQVFDRAMKAVLDIVDMPDRRATLLIKLILQNRGVLSNKKREHEFPELTDTEIQLIETSIREIESNSDIAESLQEK